MHWPLIISFSVAVVGTTTLAVASVENWWAQVPFTFFVSGFSFDVWALMLLIQTRDLPESISGCIEPKGATLDLNVVNCIQNSIQGTRLGFGFVAVLCVHLIGSLITAGFTNAFSRMPALYLGEIFLGFIMLGALLASYWPIMKVLVDDARRRGVA